MRIAIIVFVGILSYSAVVLPGYFYFVPGGAEEISNLKTLTELPVEGAAKSSTKLNIAKSWRRSDPLNDPSLIIVLI